MGNLVDQALAQYKGLISTQQAVVETAQNTLNASRALMQSIISGPIINSTDFGYPTMEIVNIGASNQNDIGEKIAWRFLQVVGPSIVVKGPENYIPNWAYISFYSPIYPLESQPKPSGPLDRAAADAVRTNAQSMQAICAERLRARWYQPQYDCQVAWNRVEAVTLAAAVNQDAKIINLRDSVIPKQSADLVNQQKILDNLIAESADKVAAAKLLELENTKVVATAAVDTALASDTTFQTNKINQQLAIEKDAQAKILEAEKAKLEIESNKSKMLFGGIGLAIFVIGIALIVLLKK